MRRLLHWTVAAVCWLALLATLAWGCAAIWIDGPTARPVAGALAAAFGLGALAFLMGLRPLWRAVAAYGVLFLMVLGWWLSILPSNDRHWLPDVANPPTAVLDGDLLTIHDVRNFDYRSVDDFTPRWETRTYDLSRLTGMDIYFFYWGSPYIAHTIMSWEFEEQPPLAISIETRKEVGEEYSTVLGFFRHFELYYVVADERDLIRLRTNFRGEDGYLFRLAWSPDDARRLLLTYVAEFDRLARTPRWYNAFTHNCTTTIRFHVGQIGLARAWNWRVLANGKGPELLYMRGVLNTTLPLPELLERSDVSARAKAAGDASDFSRRIRDGLPPRP